MAASRYIELDVPVVTQYCIEQVHALEQSFTDQHRRLLEVHVESGKESASLPLVKAALHNDVLDCAARLAHGDSPLEIDPECGMSALHAAALHGDDTLMSILLNHSDVTPEVLRNHVTINGQSVLDIVLSHKNREVSLVMAFFFFWWTHLSLLSGFGCLALVFIVVRVSLLGGNTTGMLHGP